MYITPCLIDLNLGWLYYNMEFYIHSLGLAVRTAEVTNSLCMIVLHKHFQLSIFYFNVSIFMSRYQNTDKTQIMSSRITFIFPHERFQVLI